MRRMIARFTAVLSCVLLVCVCASCCSAAAESGEASAKEPGEEPVQIGVTFESFVIERWERDRDIFVSTAKDLGASVNVQNATGDVERQKEQIRYFIDKKTDVIVVIAVDCTALKKEVEEAHEAGIPVIAYDRLILGSGVDLYTGAYVVEGDYCENYGFTVRTDNDVKLILCDGAHFRFPSDVLFYYVSVSSGAITPDSSAMPP